MSKFKVGDKIRCIDTNWQGTATIVPVYQGIYTIRGIDIINNAISFYLEEIPINQNNEIQSFLAWHFEKATEKGLEIIAAAKKQLKVKEFQNN